MTRVLKPCGTTAAYMRHWRRRETATVWAVTEARSWRRP